MIYYRWFTNILTLNNINIWKKIYLNDGKNTTNGNFN